MPSLLRSLTKRIFITLTIVVTGIFLLSCVAWYIPPGKYWYIALLGVGFAFLCFSVFCLLLFWVVFRSRWFMVPFFALLIGWKPINAFFAVHPFSPSTEKKEPGSFRIMQWNVARFDEMTYRPHSRKSKRIEILDYVRKQQPDIICMQEFLESNNLKLLDANIPYFKDTLGYSYFSYAMDHRRPDKRYEHGIAIFSKYPIRNTGRWKFGGPKSLKADESYIYADIEINGKIIRVFTTHLQSLLFTSTEFKNVEDIKKGDDSTIEKSWAIFRKFRQAYGFRQKQAELVREQLDKSPYPVIICGDFNDVPNSFAYHRIKGERQDVFTQKGFGIGRTFSSISPTLRIDYILADQRFRVVQCRNPHPRLSDHFPVIADLVLENPE
ncbi:endonuclease/exonuclease/phosphatase family protein [Flavihumibacter profundi]|uniref:endonuclease/exonuclease/phosphatase family protein n=1 Tax=Flavihumibacter profundi TaxID=2716883 RepID=UPI001CC60E71|nr:endonuclease/exonuclease/phosphatase family protein [Flavihumibacter profundi]MBZ5858794.1 endonuclease/exonuclease/phosphatase family protein [Flavihumibacter profundi]